MTPLRRSSRRSRFTSSVTWVCWKVVPLAAQAKNAVNQDAYVSTSNRRMSTNKEAYPHRIYHSVTRPPVTGVALEMKSKRGHQGHAVVCGRLAESSENSHTCQLCREQPSGPPWLSVLHPLEERPAAQSNSFIQLPYHVESARAMQPKV